MQSNKYYFYLLTISAQCRYILSFLFLAILFFLWLFCIYRPIDRSIQTYKQEISHIKKQQRQLHVLEKKYSDVQTAIALKEMSFKKLIQELPLFDASIFLKYINGTTLQLRSYAKEKESNKNNYTKYNVHASLLGSLSEIQQLIEQLQEQHGITMNKSFSLHAQDSNFLIQTTFHTIAYDQNK